MSLEMTPWGRQAYDLMTWAYEDPDNRAEQALERVNDMARKTQPDTQQAREISDVAVQLSRLSATRARTISDQVAQ